MTYRPRRQKKDIPKATVIDSEPDKIVIAVDMDQYWKWAATWLNKASIKALKKISSQEDMEIYLKANGIDFVFGTRERQLDLPLVNIPTYPPHWKPAN